MKGREFAKILEGPGGYALAILAGGIVVYMLWNHAKSAAAAVASAAGGLLSGNNAITANTIDWGGAPETAYQGKGVPGTVGAAINTVSGGAAASLGNWIGGGLYSLFNPTYNPNASGGGGSSGASGSATQVAAANSPSSETGAALPTNGSDVLNWGLQGNGW